MLLLLALLNSSFAQDSHDFHGVYTVAHDEVLEPEFSFTSPSDDTVSASLMFEQAKNPLVLMSEDSRLPLVNNLTVANLSVTVPLTKQTDVLVYTPLYLQDSSVSVGKSRLGVTQTVLSEKDVTVSVGGFVAGSLDHSQEYLSDDKVSGSLVSAVELRKEDYLLGTNLGVEFAQTSAIYNFDGGERLLLSGFGGYQVTDATALKLEVQARPSFKKNSYVMTDTPSEAMVSVETQDKSEQLHFSLGGSTALTKGASAATWRAFAGVSYSFKEKEVEPVPQPEVVPSTELVVEEPLVVPVPQEPEVFVLDPVYFDFDKDTLKEESYVTLNYIVEVMKSHTGLTLDVMGHTDSVGSDEYNQNLSYRRAQTVVGYLTFHGVELSRLSPSWFGETTPEVENDTVDHRALNRRVEFEAK